MSATTRTFLSKCTLLMPSFSTLESRLNTVPRGYADGLTARVFLSCPPHATLDIVTEKFTIFETVG